MGPRHCSALPVRHIRLLSIDPSQNPPSGNLAVVSLDDDPVFTALSYAWSDPGNILHFVCSGEVLHVHENLGDFLRQTRGRNQGAIWIDAICINQNDDAEKNHQIPLMGEIYNKAARILVWLGTNSIDEDKACAVISLLANGMTVVFDQENEAPFPDPSSLGVPPWYCPVWGDIGALFARKWFQRLWVMQEVCSARKIYVLCGKEGIEWDTLVEFVAGILRHEIPFNFLTSRSFDEDVRLGMESVPLLDTMRRRHEPSHTIDTESYKISILLCSIRQRVAAKAVDKVYGSLSMMPSDIQEALTVDVNMSQAQVYAAFAKCLFRCGDASLILCHASHSMQSRGLPSWCPDLAERPSTDPFGAFYTSHGFAVGHEPTPSGKEKIKLLQDWAMIETIGFVVTTISDTVSLEYNRPAYVEDPADLLKWDHACFTMAKRFIDPPDHDRMAESLCETLVGGGRCSTIIPSQPVSAWVQDHENWKSITQKWVESGDSGAPLLMTKSAKRFTTSLNLASYGRRVFMTQGKHFGLGALHTQVGDLVCILYGRPTPFILRLNLDECTYTQVGEAYVNGIMDGEALDMREKCGLEDRTFFLK